MKKKVKVYPSQVEDYLKENGVTTIRELAVHFECTPTTIRRKLAVLREDGRPVLPSVKGIILAEKIQDEDMATLVLKSAYWLVRTLMSLARIASITKKPLLQAKKVKALSVDDRKQLRQTLLMLTHTIDLVEIEEEFAPKQIEIQGN